MNLSRLSRFAIAGGAALAIVSCQKTVPNDVSSDVSAAPVAQADPAKPQKLIIESVLAANELTWPIGGATYIDYKTGKATYGKATYVKDATGKGKEINKDVDSKNLCNIWIDYSFQKTGSKTAQSPGIVGFDTFTVNINNSDKSNDTGNRYGQKLVASVEIQRPVRAEDVNDSGRFNNNFVAYMDCIGSGTVARKTVFDPKYNGYADQIMDVLCKASGNRITPFYSRAIHTNSDPRM